MGRAVTIITTVAVSGEGICLSAGDLWEVSEDVAAVRINLGLARPVDESEPRETVVHGGQEVETAAVVPPVETRAAPRRAPRKRSEGSA